MDAGIKTQRKWVDKEKTALFAAIHHYYLLYKL